MQCSKIWKKVLVFGKLLVTDLLQRPFLKKIRFFLQTKMFFCLFYFSIFRPPYILKQVFWGRNLISIFLASQNRYHTNTEVSQIWMKKQKKIVDTKNVFTHQDPDMIYLLICMAMILGFVFFLTSEVTIFLRLFKQTMHQKVFFGIIIYYYTIYK